VSPSSENCNPPRRVKPSGGLVVPHAPRGYQRAGAWAVFALVRAVAGTLRCHYRDRSGFLDGRAGPAIYCTWHNRLPLCLELYHNYVMPRTQTAGLAAMVSASKDGAFLASILECFKVQPVRGSSSRRGPQALLELTTWAERGYDLAITPDGPRGPRYVVQEGVMSLAQLTGLPIVGLVSPELEGPLAQLGPVSNPAALHPVRVLFRKTPPCPPRSLRRPARGPAPATRANPQ